ncbi:hypothetical protein [Acinetobacter pittii]|uniref:hypothetical protein n=1 Tax=Acinetobacter pittii TaxID=48296 RepID=UPI00301DDC7E
MFSTTLMDLSNFRKHLCVPLFLCAILTELAISKSPWFLILSTLGNSSLFIKIMVYIFDSEDKFELTYDELVEIISKARLAGPKLIPVLEGSKITSN